MTRIKNPTLKAQMRNIVMIFIFIVTVVILSFYFTSKNILEKRFKEYVVNTISSVEKNICDQFNNSLNSAYVLAYSAYVQNYIQAKTPLEKLQGSKNIDEITYYVKTLNKQILNVFIFDENNRSITASSSVDEICNNKLLDIHLNKQSTRYYFSKVFFKDSLDTDKEDHYYLVYPIYSTNRAYKFGARIGTVILQLNTKYIKDLIVGLDSSKDTKFFVIDQNNKVAACNMWQYDRTEIENDFFYNMYNSNEEIRIIKKVFDYDESYIGYKALGKLPWKIIGVTPVKNINKDLILIRNFGMIAFILTLLVIAVIQSRLVKGVTKPINTIISFIKDEQRNFKNSRLKKIEDNEIGELTVYINTMLDTVESMNNEILSTQKSLYEMEILKKQAEISALQSQINPHFLYNTLECIRSIALVYEADEISTIATSMSKMFRYSIKSKDLVKIHEELDIICGYLKIMNIRYSGKFNVDINIEEGIKGCMMPKMVLQPIVENAIYHGLEPKLEEGTLSIIGYGCENFITFEIKDNGVGIEEGKLLKIQRILETGKSYKDASRDESIIGIGIININERIKNMENGKCGVKIYSEEGVGTTVVIKLPILRN